MKISIFAIIFITVFVLINIYISRRFIRKLHFSKKYKNYLNIFLILNFIGILFYLIARYEISTPNWLYFLLSLPIGVLFILFCITLIYDISLFVSERIRMSKKRREFFKKSLDITAVGFASLLSAKAIHEAMYIDIVKNSLKLENLKDPYRIVQISDLHIGGLIDQPFVKDVVKSINAQNPDIAVLTGDIIDIDIEYISEAIDELKNIKAKYGTYFVLGNHEYFHNAYKVIKRVEEIGIRVLKNENVYIGENGRGFNLAGVFDVIGERFDYLKPDLSKSLENIDSSSPTVLLAHQPRYVENVKDVDLMLSGHTHGGQIFPFGMLVRLQQPYLRGLYRHDERLQVYVSKGVGYWGPPMRLFATSEISVIDIS